MGKLSALVCDHHPLKPAYGNLCCDARADTLEKAAHDPYKHLGRFAADASFWLVCYRADELAGCSRPKDIKKARHDLKTAVDWHARETMGA